MMSPICTCRVNLMSNKTWSNLEVCAPGKFCVKLYSEPQYLPRITNLYGLVDEERRIFLFFCVIDYEFSIIDHYNNLIIDPLSALADDRPITDDRSLYTVQCFLFNISKCYKPCRDSPTIMAGYVSVNHDMRRGSCQKRHMREAICICMTEGVMNTDKGDYKLSHIYDEIIWIEHRHSNWWSWPVCLVKFSAKFVTFGYIKKEILKSKWDAHFVDFGDKNKVATNINMCRAE